MRTGYGPESGGPSRGRVSKTGYIHCLYLTPYTGAMAQLVGLLSLRKTSYHYVKSRCFNILTGL